MSEDSSRSRKPEAAGDAGAERGIVSRRSFLKGLSAGGIGTTLLPYGGVLTGAGVAAAAAQSSDAGEVLGPGRVPVTLRVDGRNLRLGIEPRETLLDALRQGKLDNGEYVDATGNKRVCDRASCGACSMIVDGKLVYGCTFLAIEAQGKEITTVEGLGDPDDMHAVQAAFVERDALMCGFCTPGMVVAVAALLQDNPNPTRDQIRKALDGNICRCGTYPRIFEAAETAASRLRGEA